MSVAGRKLTIRMPDNRRLRGAEVVGIHVDPGGRVREGIPVMTVMTAEGEQRIRAPRPGRAIPLVTVGDEVLGGDPLFILNLDEHALTSAKSQSKRTMLGRGVEAFTTAKREGMATGAPAGRPQNAWNYDEAREGKQIWLKPGLAGVVYAIACFALLPVLRQFGGGANSLELLLLVGIAVAIAFVIALFLMPAYGRWPRMVVRFVSLSWLALVAAVLGPRVINPPPPAFIADGGAGDGATFAERGGGNSEAADARTDQAPLAPPPAIIRSGVLVGQTDIVPMPRVTQPGRLANPTDNVTAHNVTVREWSRIWPGRQGGTEVSANLSDVALRPQGPMILARTEHAPGNLDDPAAVPGNLPDPTAKGLTLLAERKIGAPEATASASLGEPTEDPSVTFAAGLGVVTLATSPSGAVVAPETFFEDMATPRSWRPGTEAGTLDLTLNAVPASDLEADLGPDGLAMVVRLSAIEVIGHRHAEPVIARLSASVRGLSVAAEVDADDAVRLSATKDETHQRSPAEALEYSALDLNEGGAQDRPHGPSEIAIVLGDGLVERPAADPSITGATPLMETPERPVLTARLASDKAPDPFANRVHRSALGGWMDAPDLSADTELAMSEDLTTRQPDSATTLQPVVISTSEQSVAERPVAPESTAVTPARAGRLAGVAPPADDTPDVMAGQDKLDRRAVPTLLPSADVMDPVLIATARAGEAGWMRDQAERAAKEHGDVSGSQRDGDSPVRREDGVRPAIGGRLAATAPTLKSINLTLSDRTPEALSPTLEAAMTDGRISENKPEPGRIGPAPVLSAIGAELRATDIPGAVPEVPPVGPEPATRMVLFLFFDDPRLKSRPITGSQWTADLPADLASRVWSSRVVATHDIIQVEDWCGGGAGQAWLNDRIRLLQVRVDMDPAVVSAFEEALPIFGDTPPGFFHNRRPLMGGAADQDLIARARAYLRGMPGSQFYDDARSLIRAMRKAGCSSAVWNGGAGPANALGTQLQERFGS